MIKENNKIENARIQVLIEPCITEATTAMAAFNKYVFKVRKEATKLKIKMAVEKIYGVKVISVRTINTPSKVRFRGRTKGIKSGYKKAIVTLKKGDSIDFFGNK